MICRCYEDKRTCTWYKEDKNSCFTCSYGFRKTQYELLQEIIEKAKINIVTCGMCGDVLLHEIGDTILKCEYCGFSGEPCEFPDLLLEPEEDEEGK